MSKYRFFCESCNVEHDHALLNGYFVGERLLENVMFEIRIADDGTFTATTPPESAAYMDDLNEAKWLKRVAEYAKNRDVFTCPRHGCSEDIENPY